MGSFTLNHLFALIGCGLLLWIAISLSALLKKISRIIAVLIGSDASTGATGGTPIKVGPGPKGWPHRSIWGMIKDVYEAVEKLSPEKLQGGEK